MGGAHLITPVTSSLSLTQCSFFTVCQSQVPTYAIWEHLATFTARCDKLPEGLCVSSSVVEWCCLVFSVRCVQGLGVIDAESEAWSFSPHWFIFLEKRSFIFSRVIMLQCFFKMFNVSSFHFLKFNSELLCFHSGQIERVFTIEPHSSHKCIKTFFFTNFPIFLTSFNIL